MLKITREYNRTWFKRVKSLRQLVYSTHLRMIYPRLGTSCLVNIVAIDDAK